MHKSEWLQNLMLPDPKPLLFIGSSTEGLEPARAIRNLLDSEVQSWLWNEAFFQFGLGFLESLVVRLKTFDFAVLVATPDDETTSHSFVVKPSRQCDL